MKTIVKVIPIGKDRVVIQESVYEARPTDRFNCECCDICNKYGRCVASDKMMGYCTEMVAKKRQPVAWRELVLANTIGEIVAQAAMETMDDTLIDLTPHAQTDFVRCLREGIAHLDVHGTFLDYTEAF